MAVYVQAKIRLKLKTNEFLKQYCEINETTQSKVIDKALMAFFETDKNFAMEVGLDSSFEHDVITVNELENKIFERYSVMIYIHAEQSEKIGINLTSWPKCMGKYTIREFKEKILQRCLAKAVNVTVIDAFGQSCNPRTTIKTLKQEFLNLKINLNSFQEFHDYWSNYSESIS
ncbi:hypothetical protein QCD60_22360 [Pokkaliibacter sp. MBI-7]|uniref:hypothetical protein n=1 Tax=Pokkaliibacter sp. MBI-7 TaxID=3040600 RepID=UPI00244C919B|nr:hypothetical protein [Pokkaliibacter sp. MBI-7]MDH2435272.1 hypothetical protein [Pokkaliibacter sp. MBI-7]